nr:MAG TPA: hypothetical protein [Caudoviricetes sp.]
MPSVIFYARHNENYSILLTERNSHALHRHFHPQRLRLPQHTHRADLGDFPDWGCRLPGVSGQLNTHPMTLTRVIGFNIFYQNPNENYQLL